MTNTSLKKNRTTLIALLLLAAMPLCAQQVEFREAIQLALKHSGIMAAASADRTRAAARYRAERDAFIPTVVFGANPGYSVGVAIAIAGQVPSLYNITHNEAIYNPALNQTIKAAHSDSLAANIDYADRSEQVILDTSLLYIELDNTQQRLVAAQGQKQSVDHALYITRQRHEEGVSSVLETKRAELDAARVDLRISELETSADILRERLGRSIGRSPATLTTVSASIPATPSLPSADDVASIALANSNSIRVADEHVRAARFRARSEHRVKYPSIDLGGQFSQLVPYLNYGLTKTPTYDYGIALGVRIPIINLSQNARAAAADAEALHAEADAEVLRDQVAADAVRSQHTIRQLEASAKVTRLEYEFAQANIDEVQLQIQMGRATARDQEMAQAEIANRQILLLTSEFEYLRAQLQLLRQTGLLSGWALGGK